MPLQQPILPRPHSLSEEPTTVAGAEVQARLARRDPSDWPWILSELRGIAGGLAPSFRDVCGEDDVLGELALRAHERWIEDWLTSGGKVSARVFLRDRLRDHLRELRRQKERRGALLRGVVPGGAVVETESGPHRALLASPPERPDEALEAAQLQRQLALATAGSGQILALRAAGFEQHEIAARTGLSRPTVGRRLASIAAVLAALGSVGLLLARGGGETSEIRDVGSDGAAHGLAGAPPAPPPDEAPTSAAAPDSPPAPPADEPAGIEPSARDDDPETVGDEGPETGGDESPEAAGDEDPEAVGDEDPLRIPDVFRDAPTRHLPSDEASSPAFLAERVERLRVAFSLCAREPGATVRLELVPTQEASLGVSGFERACVASAVATELRRGRPRGSQTFRYRVDEDRGVHFEARDSTPITAPVSPRPAPRRPVTIDDLSQARICASAADHECVIRLLGGGRARTAAELYMLANAERSRTGVQSACGTITTLLQRFPRSREAQVLRAIHVTLCESRW
jgi:hypothetical protein